MATALSYDGLFASPSSFQKIHTTEFTSEAGEALRLTVRQNLKSKGGMKKFGRSTLVFDFQPAGAITAENSPSTSGRSAVAAAGSAGAWTEGAGEGAVPAAGGGERVNGESSDRVVLVHDRYNGAKQLYVNRALVYTVKKECTDGNMNSWVVKLSFGSVVLSLICKLFSSSGFEYALTFGGDGTQLYKGTQ